MQLAIGTMINDLVHKPNQIQEILKYFKEQDVLMKRLLDISTTFNAQKVRQNVHLCILRTDYMVDAPTSSIKLVEYNTIASSFGCLCQKVTELQEYVKTKYSRDLKYNYGQSKGDDNLGKTYIKDLAQVFRDTIYCYKESVIEVNPDHPTQIEDIWVAFIVDKIERNICDQKLIETTLYDDHGIKSMRVTFEDVTQYGLVHPVTKILTVKGKEIGFVYFRTGYQLEQYPSESDWKARETLECSMSVKCPSIDVQLTTFKKFQQAFSDEKLLQNIMIEHPEQCEEIKILFQGIWTLEDLDKPESEIHEIVKKAIEHPHNYVLKPQKEGGGHNFYDDQVKEMLQNEPKENLKQYLIMERINPPEIKGYMFRNGQIIEGETLSELGIFSNVFIDTTQSDPLENKLLGRLLRTKAKQSNEGGVNAGFAVIDSPLLVDIDLSSKIRPTVDEF